MAGLTLYPYQVDAVKRMKNGCILHGGVGSGKSRTALAYYYILNGGELNTEEYVPMDDRNILDLYIITTARKRDTLEWDAELIPFLLSTDKEQNLYCNKVVIDSWNNISKYKEVKGAFFIFDEQRVVGKGAWVNSYLRIAKNNQWILLSATPGDTWMDYIPVFIANGFYKNRSEFLRRHVVFSRFAKYPKVERYLDTGRLIRLRKSILVDMDYEKKTEAHHKDVWCDYDIPKYKALARNRWDPWEEKPIATSSELCYAMRRAVNESPARQNKVLEIVESHPRCIIFYLFDYELEILKKLPYPEGTQVAEWNGHKHQPIPTGSFWVYLVQYTAGCEGWNCTSTDTIIFYSQNYSYKVLAQASGRIDRLNTKYNDLYYYHLKSRSGIDLAISKALEQKKDFNERRFVDGHNFGA